jgi:HAE1 family hydrophobic/amphiphilic exporter-1
VSTCRILAAALLFSAVGSAAQAQSPLPPRVGIVGERSITLGEAVALAMANNPDVAISRGVIEQATNDIAAAQGVFDPLLSTRLSLQRQVTPVSSLIGGSASGSLTQQGFAFGPGVQGRLSAFGTKYQVAFNSRRQTTDNQFVTLNPQFPSDLGFNITQPLFRGRGIDSDRRQLTLAKQNQAMSDEQFKQVVMDLALQTELAYGDLFFAEQTLAIQLEALQLARDQVRSNQRLVDRGTAAPIDVLEAETQAATFEQDAIAAQALVARLENSLKALILPDRLSPLWSTALRPTTTFPPESPIESVEDAVRLALANRPELKQSQVAAATNQSETAFFRDQRKPQVDLIAGYLNYGLAGRLKPAGPNPLTLGTQPLIDRLNILSATQGLAPIAVSTGAGSSVPEALTGGWGQSMSTMAGLNFPSVEVGVQISLPFNNRSADARFASSLVEGRRLRLQEQRLEQGVEAEVRNALQGVVSARAGLGAARQARTAAEDLYASEQRKFEAGTSTVFLVLQRQSGMIAARNQHARSETELWRAHARMKRATGEILAAHQITMP